MGIWFCKTASGSSKKIILTWAERAPVFEGYRLITQNCHRYYFQSCPYLPPLSRPYTLPETGLDARVLANILTQKGNFERDGDNVDNIESWK